jgi:hypothetical protein
MLNLDDLKTAKNNIAQKRSGNAESAFNEGKKILELYKLNPSVSRLEHAGRKFVEALEYNNEHIPSLIYVSFILFALGNEEMAMKYIKTVEILKPALPKDINNYKEAIEKRIAGKAKIK